MNKQTGEIGITFEISYRDDSEERQTKMVNIYASNINNLLKKIFVFKNYKIHISISNKKVIGLLYELWSYMLPIQEQNELLAKRHNFKSEIISVNDVNEIISIIDKFQI